jgi:O-succinylbenzoate synthase
MFGVARRWVDQDFAGLRLIFFVQGEQEMIRTIVLVSAVVGALASCTATEQGTAIGAGTGAVIGGAVTNSWGGAAVGAVAGGVAGALIGQSTERRGYCVYRDRYGRTYEARCR